MTITISQNPDTDKIESVYIVLRNRTTAVRTEQVGQTGSQRLLIDVDAAGNPVAVQIID